MNKRILILYITNLSGHYKAAKAIEKSLKEIDKDCHIYSLDLFKYLHPYSSAIINFLYSLVIKRLPYLWGGIYDKNLVIKGLNPLKGFNHFCNRGKIRRLINKIKPQAVICTQAFPCGVASFFKSSEDKFSLIGVVTDFWPNSFWFYKEVDYYVTFSGWSRYKFEQAGIDPEKLKNLGIPIRPEFSREYAKAEIATEFNLNKNLPAILIMGGSSGIGPIKHITSSLDKSNQDFQMIVVCGKNRKLYRWFTRQHFKKPLKFFSYIEEVYKLMSFSDVIISKPGGITISESLSKGLAIIVLKPIPGQEENNLKFLLKEKLALAAQDPGQVRLLIEDLLQNRDKLEKIKERNKSFSKPDSSNQIAKLILDSING